LLGKLAKKSRIFRWLWNEEAKATACRLKKVIKIVSICHQLIEPWGGLYGYLML
jgi:hypothetical protein